MAELTHFITTILRNLARRRPAIMRGDFRHFIQRTSVPRDLLSIANEVIE
jgi:hypothetical protein